MSIYTAIYDTFSCSQLKDRRANYESEAAKVQYIQPVELNPISEKITYLYHFRQLGDNWDGYGAKRPSDLALDNTVKFLKMLPFNYQKILSVDELNITPYGTVVMEWTKDQQHFISIEIGKSKVGFFSETQDGENPFAHSIEITPNEVSKQILPALNKVFS